MFIKSFKCTLPKRLLLAQWYYMQGIIYCSILLQNTGEALKAKEVRLTVRDALNSKIEDHRESDSKPPKSFDDSDEDDISFDARMCQQIIRKRKELGDLSTKQELPNGEPTICRFLCVIFFCSITRKQMEIIVWVIILQSQLSKAVLLPDRNTPKICKITTFCSSLHHWVSKVRH